MISIPMIGAIASAVKNLTPSIPTSGLILEWTFDSISGSTVNDTSPVATHVGTISGASVVSGHKGNALSFDGINDLCSTPDASDIRASIFSVSFWIKTTTTNNTVVAEKDGNDGWSIQTSSSELPSAGNQAGRIILNSGGTTTALYGYSLINDNQFHHIVMINNGSSDKCYIDNIDVTSSSTKGNPTYSTGPLIIGQRVGNVGPFPGIIDQFRFYNRALTAGEVTQLFNEI